MKRIALGLLLLISTQTFSQQPQVLAPYLEAGKTKVSVVDTAAIRQRAIDFVMGILSTYVTSTQADSLKGLMVLKADSNVKYLSPAAVNSLNTGLRTSIDSVKSKVLFTQTGTQTISATTTKTSIVGSGIGSLIIPANALIAGKTYRMHLEGVYSTPVLLNLANITCRFEINGTAVTTATATTLLASATNSAFVADELITIRTTGASGTLVATGQLAFASSATTRAYLDMNTGTSTFVINTTIANTFTPTVQFSNANAGNSVSSLICTFEQLN